VPKAKRVSCTITTLPSTARWPFKLQKRKRKTAQSELVVRMTYGFTAQPDLDHWCGNRDETCFWHQICILEEKSHTCRGLVFLLESIWRDFVRRDIISSTKYTSHSTSWTATVCGVWDV
jgi:hypothetical protein